MLHLLAAVIFALICVTAFLVAMLIHKFSHGRLDMWLEWAILKFQTE